MLALEPLQSVFDVAVMPSEDVFLAAAKFCRSAKSLILLILRLFTGEAHMAFDKSRESDPTPRLRKMAVDKRQRKKMQEQLYAPGVCPDFREKVRKVLEETEP
ncbi:hypothetical protein [Comamonas sp. 4034]|uniref:hypothetical protein n=1 Tax=Comamonas sp. 4034 TaxID=3156455 RepID=UPI003D1C658B